MTKRIYLDFCGGNWEARFWDYDEQRYYTRTSHDSADAVRKLRKFLGYKPEEIHVVRIDAAQFIED